VLVSRPTSLRLLTALLAGSLIAACGSTTAPPPPPPPTLQTVELSAPGATLPKGTSRQLVATGRYSDGTAADVSTRATWSSGAPAIATVSGAGLVSAVSVGSAEVTAVVDLVTGRATVVVGPAVPVSLEVTPAPLSVALGLTATFQASQYVMSDGTRSPVVGDVTWSAQPAAVATIDATGLARSLAQGTADIRASQGALTGTSSLTVSAPVPASIAVSPAVFTVFPGRPKTFTALATLTDGTTKDVSATAAWSSSNPAVFPMSGATALSDGRGSTVITASAGGASGTASLSTLDTRIAFTTSTHGTGDLGSWSYGVGKTGARAADAICQSSARAGKLPGTYLALLSDANDDAYCRLHELSGTVAGKCGQDALPATAGPWMRTDGKPFAPRIDRMLDGEVYNPLGFDEYGVPSFAWAAFTGTNFRGAREFGGSYGDCLGWTSAIDSSLAMAAYDSSTSFAIGGAANVCSGNAKLMCFEVAAGEGPALPPRTAAGKLAFMTSVTGPGNLAAWADAGTATGIAAGDAVCRARATAAGLANAERFKAWLSDATTHARLRISSDGPWVRPDRVLVAANKAELLSGTLSSPISMTETGRYVNWIPGVSTMWDWSTLAWTGTTQGGSAAPDHCLSWQTAEAYGAQGFTTNILNWSHLLGMPPADCSMPRALYCLED